MGIFDRPQTEIKKPQIERKEDPQLIFSKALEESAEVSIRPEDRNEAGILLVSPDGPVSNLTEEYWKLVRTPSFKKWFGDSDIKDENGEPALVFHRTNNDIEEFNSFSKENSAKKRLENGSLGETGFYFTSGEYHSGNNRLSVFINAHVKEVTDRGKMVFLKEDLAKKTQQDGYTGLIHTFENAEQAIETIKETYRRNINPKTIANKIFFGFNKIFKPEKNTEHEKYRLLNSFKMNLKNLHKIQKGATSPFYEILVFEPEQIMIVKKEQNDRAEETKAP